MNLNKIGVVGLTEKQKINICVKTFVKQVNIMEYYTMKSCHEQLELTYGVSGPI